ncbi:hypothetical protein ABTX15_32450 [Micromonospora sp. NPDC094482]|uniref:hypothetical protein n=1 Tax=unclassified Micromonospora TaxID=2617518 RepID=UPI00331D2BD9
MTIRRTGVLLAVISSLVLAATGCGDSGPAEDATPPSAHSGEASPMTTEAVNEQARPSPPATQSARPAALPPATDTDPACRSTTLLAATDAALNAEAVAQVEVLACRNGFARLLAIAPGQAETSDGSQVFLRSDNSVWQVVGRASAGTDCGDPGLSKQIRMVCEGLV